MKTRRNKETLNLIKNGFLIIALGFLLAGSAGCKSKKKIVVEDPKENTEKVDAEMVKAKSTLKELLSDDCTKSIEEKEKILADIKAMNLNDEELNSLIKEVENSIANEKEEIRIAEEKAKEAAKPENKLRNYFDQIAKAPNENEANNLINEAVEMFTSDQSNVLIIISQSDHIKDYDKPTKIRAYLNYLKDTKNNINVIEKIHWDASGTKIKTLELKKVK
ncbi:MAG: hypothetical protein P1P88_22005 [Bacteroidales bacterium]|nr:hypothetical protein [Bacteroidales bacterium]